MNLDNFEEFIDEVIVERGRDYFDDDCVLSLKCHSLGVYSARVSGSEVYTVRVELEAGGEIMSSFCDCPYDMGPICKHQVAVFFSLAEGFETSTVLSASRGQEMLSALRLMLDRRSREEITNIVLDVAKREPTWAKQLLYKYVEPQDEMAVSRELIWSTIKTGEKIRTVVEANRAMRGASQVLDKASDHIAKGDVQRATVLCFEVLSVALQVLPPDLESEDEFDAYGDEDGAWLSIVDEGIDCVEQAVRSCLGALGEEKQEQLLESIVSFAGKYRRGPWSEAAVSLVLACAPLAELPHFRVVLNGVMDEVLGEIIAQNGHDDYRALNIKRAQYRLVQKYDGEVEIDRFLGQNLRFLTFRREAVLRARDREDYATVITLAQKGEAQDPYCNEGPWKEFLYEAYEKLGDVENLRVMTLEFFFRRGFEYYPKLKQLYSSEEWPDIQVRVIAQYEKSMYPDDVYMSFLVAEGLTGHLVYYCTRDVRLLERYYPHLMDKHPHEVQELFIAHIKNIATYADSRNKYRDVCGVLDKYSNACGQVAAEELVSYLLLTYPRKRALVEELSWLRKRIGSGRE